MEEHDDRGHHEHAQRHRAHPRGKEHGIEIAGKDARHDCAGNAAYQCGGGETEQVERTRQQDMFRTPAAHQHEDQPAFDQIGNGISHRGQDPHAGPHICCKAGEGYADAGQLAPAGAEQQQRSDENAAGRPDRRQAIRTLGELECDHRAHEPAEAEDDRPRQFRARRNRKLLPAQLSPPLAAAWMAGPYRRLNASASCRRDVWDDLPHRRDDGACLPRKLRNCLRTIRHGCRLRRPGYAWRGDRGRNGHAR